MRYCTVKNSLESNSFCHIKVLKHDDEIQLNTEYLQFYITRAHAED